MSKAVVEEKIRVAMVGTALNTQGGVATVANVLQAGGLFERFAIDYFASHRDGSGTQKIIAVVRAWLRFMWVLIRGKTDVIHVHMASRASFWRKLLFIAPSYVFNVPYVIHLHGGEFRDFYGKESSTLSKAIISWVFQKAASVIALSKSWRKWLADQFPRSKVVAIYNPTVVLPDDEAVRCDNQGSPNILFLGRLGIKKGVFDLLDAVSRIQKEIPAVRLLLAGDGDLQAVAERAAGLGISDNVELLGWIDSKRKHDLLRHASVFALPSYNEGLPMGVLEAMAAGVPVVATPVGGIPEAVEDGIHGFLVEPGNVDLLAERLAQLLRDPDLRRFMGLAGRAKADSVFSVERIVEQIATVYIGIAKREAIHGSRS